ncbi:glycosyltransferase [Subsaximicrobium wynnwilliamsii]|uniref:Glycosyltransferase n=1 Tax=Subsaximicrobium wynnwilliamsii TaxID=291179 RepID=A0A5C6ZK12_9FLAO|nr:glycosyltransferase family 2 protein [Subsaximicrobium wynnwilliamsii]TXD84967.1 glycosyltransferase [Subsaximicrobium wynnwilliamsii]TXD90638.1 glycosyltransferase [Subsaximicrobium wynnwilliamsii]TXE05112.1 glycosyltransferase [Subsaximicrobium wynnwilliamsii]
MSTYLKASVIISTYNKPECLAMVLYSYGLQTEQQFEIIVADDGSDTRTEKVIADFSEAHHLKISHVWQEDDGFQKTKILNKAILAASANYLVFTDGDCIARKDFVETHLKLRRENCALSGGYFKMNSNVSEAITKEVISNQSCFDKDWLLKQGQAKSFKLNKLTKSTTKAKLLNSLTPTKATFDGMNVSCWKADILRVNGFDERMAYGAEDREVGERMMNNGVKFLQIRYSAICVHLHHERPYKNEVVLEKNKGIRANTKTKKLTYTQFGIKKD